MDGRVFLRGLPQLVQDVLGGLPAGLQPQKQAQGGLAEQGLAGKLPAVLLVEREGRQGEPGQQVRPPALAEGEEEGFLLPRGEGKVQPLGQLVPCRQPLGGEQPVIAGGQGELKPAPRGHVPGGQGRPAPGGAAGQGVVLMEHARLACRGPEGHRGGGGRLPHRAKGAGLPDFRPAAGGV